MSKPSDLKAAVIGAGTIAPFHIKAYKAAGVPVVAVCDVRKERADARAKEFDIPKAYADVEEMLDKESPDVVSVCTPNACHAPNSIAAMKAGANVLCEKPMSMTVAEAEEMLKTSKETGKKLMMAFCSRFSVEAQTMKEFIDSGQAGEIYFGNALWLRRFGIPGMGSWFTRKKDAGGGALIDIGVHILDLALWLMGHPEPVAVTGVAYAKFGPRGLGLGGWGIPEPDGYFDVDDLTAGLVKFANGATIVLSIAWASYVEENCRKLRLLGTEGGVEWAPVKLYKGVSGKFVELEPKCPSVNIYDAEVEHFVDCVLNDKAPMASAEDGVRVMKILNGLYESAEKGKEITIA